MKRNLFSFVALTLMLMGVGVANAEQNESAAFGFNSEASTLSVAGNPTNDFSLQRSLYGKKDNVFAFGAQYTLCGSGKMGVGLRFGYNFTDILRFVLEGDLYLSGPNKYQTLSSTGEIKERFFGRVWDINPELNFVFGDGDFHFYLIAGLSMAYGHSKLEAVYDEAFGYNEETVVIGNRSYYKGEAIYEDLETGEEYYIVDENKPDPVFAVGLNLGCGIEYQITDAFRMSLEQSASITLPIGQTAWTWKLGAHYCF